MIKILSNDTIQKIAAGEVVESPASIVKELVENSIDANSDTITVEIKSGGKEYIKVSDNGEGIADSDLETAFIRHATSKISDFEDLFNLYTMGFRGEALSSISSVASVKIKTKNINENTGNHALFEDNILKDKKIIAMNNGTTIEVTNLFNNIPARKKFLGSDISESNKISHLMHVFAIGNKNISFTYIKDNKEIFKTNKSQSVDNNQEILFGREFIKNKIDIDTLSNNFKIKGSISNTRIYKGNRSMQYIFVNNRYINSSEITQAIESSYSNYIPNGRFPMYEIHIEVDPKIIDVNIHPNKQRIKFSYIEELLDVIKREISEQLFKSNRPKDLNNTRDIKENKISFHELNSSDGYKRVLDAYKEPISPKISDSNSIFESKINYIDMTEESINTINEYDLSNFEDEGNPETSSIKSQQIEIEYENLNYIAQLFNKYLIFESSEKEYITILDITRANQRLVFDNINHNSEIISQDLLDPIIITLNPKEIEEFNQNKDIFIEAGYEIDQFDENSIAIRQIPYFFKDPSDSMQFRDIFDGITHNKLSKDYLIKSSIAKANYKNKNINKEEAEILYKELMNSSNPYQTESGKTIIYSIYKNEFELLLNK